MSNAKVDLDLPTGIINLDITQRRTSKIYPVEVIEGYGVDAVVNSFLMFDPPDDGYEVAATISGVELRPLLITYDDGAPEAYGAAATVTALEMVTILVTYDGLPEAYGVSATVTSLALVTGLVQNEMDPEAYGVSATVTALELATV